MAHSLSLIVRAAVLESYLSQLLSDEVCDDIDELRKELSIKLVKYT